MPTKRVAVSLAAATAAVATAAAVAIAVQPGTPSPGRPGANIDAGVTPPPTAAGLTLGPEQTSYEAVAAQRDGKYVVVGQDRRGEGTRMLVARYTAAGTPDTTFGSGGFVTLTTSLPGGRSGSTGTDVAVQRDGRIVAVGARRGGGDDDGFVVARFRADGRPDTSFGRRGLVAALTGSRHAAGATSVSLGPGGRITVAGNSRSGGIPAVATALRLDGRGRLDRRFSGDGIARAASSVETRVEAADVDTRGRTYLAGLQRGSDGRSQSLLLRLTSRGSVDRSFARGGVRREDARNGAGFSSYTEVVARGTGVTVAGTARNLSSADSIVTRYAAGGSTVKSFGSQGTVRRGAAPEQAQALQEPSPGAGGLVVTSRRVFVGGTVEAVGAYRVLALSALTTSGKADTAFGAPVGPAYSGSFPFAAPGTTYTFVSGRSDDPFNGPQGQTNDLAITPDGRRLVTVGVADERLGIGGPTPARRGLLLIQSATGG